jgi:hypothetical protein
MLRHDGMSGPGPKGRRLAQREATRRKLARRTAGVTLAKREAKLLLLPAECRPPCGSPQSQKPLTLIWHPSRAALPLAEIQTIVCTSIGKARSQKVVRIEDSTAFTAPWSVVLPMTRTSEPLLEFACYEGNSP